MSVISNFFLQLPLTLSEFLYILWYYPDLLPAYWRLEEFSLFFSPYRWGPLPPELNRLKRSLTYGEINLVTAGGIIQDLMPKGGGAVLDLGAGRGRLVLLAGAMGFRAVGIELFPLHLQAFQYAGASLPADIRERVKTIEGNFLEIQWPRSDLIWAVGTCWNSEIRRQLAERFASLPPEVKIVSVSSPFYHPKLKLLRTQWGWTSWGKDRFFIQCSSP